jgi:hypothetical protein
MLPAGAAPTPHAHAGTRTDTVVLLRVPRQPFARIRERCEHHESRHGSKKAKEGSASEGNACVRVEQVRFAGIGFRSAAGTTCFLVNLLPEEVVQRRA